MDKLTLTVSELADTLNISLTSAYQLVRRTNFPSVHLGARWLVPVRALEDWLERQAKEFQVFSGAVQKVLGGESFAY